MFFFLSTHEFYMSRIFPDALNVKRVIRLRCIVRLPTEVNTAIENIQSN